jgi:uncharacterized membrane protein YebE (DUF533 family)
MDLADRLLPLTELLMGAAYADDHLTDGEKAEVRAQLLELAGGVLPVEVERRLQGFWPATFDMTAAVSPFLRDPPDVRRRLLFLVAAVLEADDAVEREEDDYLHELCGALKLSPDALIGISSTVDAGALQAEFVAVRYGQPTDGGDDEEIELDL